MYPFGWSDGEPQKPATRFSDFQGFTDTARDFAVLRGRGKPFYERVDMVRQNSAAANDNYPEGASTILTNPVLWSMLACWVACGRDMMKAKLSWSEENMKTWRLD